MVGRSALGRGPFGPSLAIGIPRILNEAHLLLLVAVAVAVALAVALAAAVAAAVAVVAKISCPTWTPTKGGRPNC